MRILLNGAKDTVLEKILPVYPRFAKYIGWLNTPRSSYCFKGLKDTGLPIACDNNAYTGFSEARFLLMLNRAQCANVSLEWVAVPDKVADAGHTDTLFHQWYPRLKQPLAYVLQDGAEDIDLPFDKFQCLFIGGTTQYKLSQTAYDIVKVAKAQGKHIHMGRVNSNKRLRIAHTFGCDSIDGTGYVRFNRREIVPALHFIESLYNQQYLEVS